MSDSKTNDRRTRGDRLVLKAGGWELDFLHGKRRCVAERPSTQRLDRKLACRAAAIEREEGSLGIYSLPRMWSACQGRDGEAEYGGLL